MLVADAFDAMRTKTIVEQGRALQRFAGHDFAGWELCFQIITSRQCATGPGR